ncbi:MAG: Coiled-coil domain-containing protein 94 [Marteilia pararefringens]
MAERKAAFKYYHPDYDPSKVPRSKGNKNAVFSIRTMAPFNMRCLTCNDFIYKGRKFNSRKEDIKDQNYLNLTLMRFYIRCPNCSSEITFRTDLENLDYEIESGATRNFDARRAMIRAEAEEQKTKEEDEKGDSMKVLENRTKSSLAEIKDLEEFEELKDSKYRNSKIDTETLLLLNDSTGKDSSKIIDEEEYLDTQVASIMKIERRIDDFVKSGNSNSSDNVLEQNKDIVDIRKHTAGDIGKKLDMSVQRVRKVSKMIKVKPKQSKISLVDYSDEDA